MPPGVAERPGELPVLSRRRFMAGSAALVGAAALGLAGCGASAPAATSAATSGNVRTWIPVSTAGLQEGEPQWVEFDVPVGGGASPAVPTGAPPSTLPASRGGAWLVLQPDGSTVAFMPSCPHQRCSYEWDAAGDRFSCRCHRGYFTIDGTVISGPPPRPLDRFEVRQAGVGVVEIGWVGPA